MIYFNPRLREGGDRLLRPILTQIQISIHASAKEATNSNHFALKLDNYFNPRLREGGDGKTTIISFPLEEISIHASAKEATDIQKQAEERMDISIHASAKEATRAGYQVHTVKIFQSTPPRRRRLISISRCKWRNYFNPRLREGGDFPI